MSPHKHCSSADLAETPAGLSGRGGQVGSWGFHIKYRCSILELAQPRPGDALDTPTRSRRRPRARPRASHPHTLHSGGAPVHSLVGGFPPRERELSTATRCSGVWSERTTRSCVLGLTSEWPRRIVDGSLATPRRIAREAAGQAWSDLRGSRSAARIERRTWMTSQLPDRGPASPKTSPRTSLVGRDRAARQINAIASGQTPNPMHRFAPAPARIEPSAYPPNGWLRIDWSPAGRQTRPRRPQHTSRPIDQTMGGLEERSNQWPVSPRSQFRSWMSGGRERPVGKTSEPRRQGRSDLGQGLRQGPAQDPAASRRPVRGQLRRSPRRWPAGQGPDLRAPLDHAGRPSVRRDHLGDADRRDRQRDRASSSSSRRTSRSRASGASSPPTSSSASTSAATSARPSARPASAS